MPPEAHVLYPFDFYQGYEQAYDLPYAETYPDSAEMSLMPMEEFGQNYDLTGRMLSD
jgi:hypothetical protein